MFTFMLQKIKTVFLKKIHLRKVVNDFLSPLRFELPKREKQFLKSAKTEAITIPVLKKEVCILRYGYSKNKILLVHGWSGRATQFYKIADKLLESGMMVIAFDAPAHGLSNGKQTSMQEFIQIIEYLHKKHSFYGAIGHSLGAMALLQSVANGLHFKRIVSISAVANIDEIILKFLNEKNKKSISVSDFKAYFKNRLQYNLENYNGIACAKKNTIKTLVIHDVLDSRAAVRNAYILRQNLQNGIILTTSGLGHTRILKDTSICKRISQFIKPT